MSSVRLKAKKIVNSSWKIVSHGVIVNNSETTAHYTGIEQLSKWMLLDGRDLLEGEFSDEKGGKLEWSMW